MTRERKMTTKYTDYVTNMSSLKECRVNKGGGIFHVAKVHYSKETQDLLKALMQESKLSLVKQNQILRTLDSGQPPASSQGSAGNCKPHTPVPAVGNVTYYEPVLPTVPGRRSLQTIASSGAYERDRYIPRVPRVDKSKEIRRFQNIMTYGTDIAPPEKPFRSRKEHSELTIPNEKEMFDHLLDEVKDRLKFLEEMRQLGEGKKYERKIMSEISDKVRMMEKIDKQGSCEFKKVMKSTSV